MTAGSSRRPWALGTGPPAQNFAQGQIKYVDLDLTRMEGKFAPILRSRERHFRGYWVWAPPDRFLPPRARGLREPVLLIKTPTICAAVREILGSNSICNCHCGPNHWQDGMLFAIIVGWE